MESGDQRNKKTESRLFAMRTPFFSGLTMAIALLVAGAGVLRGQEMPQPPEPPGPPGAEQFFVVNDGAAHLGVNLDDVTAEKAQELKLPAVAGAIVNSVQPESAAAKAGLKVGDVITEFDSVRVRSSAELRRLIRETPPGRTVTIKIVRGGKTSVLSAKLEPSSNHLNIYGPGTHIPAINMPEIRVPPFDIPEGPFTFAFHGATLGISADNLTPQLAQYFGVKQGKGVLVSEVTTGGAADRAGLKAGDVIEQVDGKPVGDVEELRSTLNDNFTGDTRKVSLTIVRDHHEMTLNAELTRSQSWEKRTSLGAGQNYSQQLAQVRAQAERERAAVAAEVQEQREQIKGEWQRQLQEQMRALKEQLQQMQDQRRALLQDGEI